MKSFANIKILIVWSVFLLPFSFGDLALAQVRGTNQECQMSKGFKYNYFIDTQNKSTGMYGTDLERLPPTVIENCRGSNGKFLGFGLGIRKPFMASDVSHISFDGAFDKEICHIQNAPKELMTYEEKAQALKAQHHALRSCTYLELTHLDNKPIQFDAVQNFCKIERRPSGKLIARGDFCYIRITPDLRVAISVSMDANCMNPDFLVKNNIEPSDIDAFLQAFIVEDPSGIYINDQIGSAPVRVSILPSEEHISLNKDIDVGGARFPNTFSADIHMGSISAVGGHNGDNPATAFRLSLFVDNRAPKSCSKNGLCAGAGDYQVPLATETLLYEYKNGKRIPIDSWYSGRIMDPFVKSQWQGLYDLGRHIVDGLEIDEKNTYEIVMNFTNPYDDFIMLTTQLQQFSIDYTLLNGTAGKDFIEPLATLNTLKLLPVLSTLPSVDTQNDPNQEYERIRQYFSKFSRDSQYPPVYENICVEGRCLKTRSNGRYLQLVSTFKFQKDEESGDLTVKNLKIQRNSPIMKSYKIEDADLPEVVCQ